MSSVVKIGLLVSRSQMSEDDNIDDDEMGVDGIGNSDLVVVESVAGGEMVRVVEGVVDGDETDGVTLPLELDFKTSG